MHIIRLDIEDLFNLSFVILCIPLKRVQYKMIDQAKELKLYLQNQKQTLHQINTNSDQ